jgi:cystathionine beta-synthase
VEWELIDGFEQVSDREAFHAARELARREGIFAGGSSGACLVALRRVLRALGPEARVATIFPDSGHRYLSTIYDDAWMRAKGLLAPHSDGPEVRAVA